MMGRMIYNKNITNDSRIDISKFNKAAYIVRLTNDKGTKTQKIVM